MGKRPWRQEQKLAKSGRLKFAAQTEVDRVMWLIAQVSRSEKPGPRNPRPSEQAQGER